jgi:diguanylate cyclase (GGDEF)-like protein
MLKLLSRLIHERATRGAGRGRRSSAREQETLCSHRYFDERLSAEIELAAAYERPFSLLAVGVDRYDAFREFHGDFKAAELRQLIAEVLHDNLRLADVATTDGHDFLVLMPETDVDDATLAYRRLQRLVSDRAAAQPDDCFHYVTISAGIFEHDGSRPPEIVRSALWALERAQALGGNTVHRFTPGWSDWKPAPAAVAGDQPVQLHHA